MKHIDSSINNIDIIRLWKFFHKNENEKLTFL